MSYSSFQHAKLRKRNGIEMTKRNTIECVYLIVEVKIALSRSRKKMNFPDRLSYGRFLYTRSLSRVLVSTLVKFDREKRGNNVLHSSKVLGNCFPILLLLLKGFAVDPLCVAGLYMYSLFFPQPLIDFFTISKRYIGICRLWITNYVVSTYHRLKKISF